MPSLQSSTVKAISKKKKIVTKESVVSDAKSDFSISTVLTILSWAIVAIPSFLTGMVVFGAIVTVIAIVSLVKKLYVGSALKHDIITVTVEPCVRKYIYADSDSSAETYYVYFGKEKCTVSSAEFNAIKPGDAFYVVRANHKVIGGFNCRFYELDDALKAKMITR